MEQFVNGGEAQGSQHLRLFLLGVGNVVGLKVSRRQGSCSWIGIGEGCGAYITLQVELGRVNKYPVIPVLNRNPVVLSPIMT